MTKLFNEIDIKKYYREMRKTMNKEDAGYATLKKSGFKTITTSLIIADAQRWEA